MGMDDIVVKLQIPWDVNSPVMKYHPINEISFIGMLRVGVL